MKRFRKRLLNSLTAFSLLLFVLATALWIRSCHLVDQIDWRHQSRYFNLLSDVGAMHLTLIHEQKYFTIAADAKRDWKPKPEDLTGCHVRDWAESISWQPNAPLWQRTGLVGASIQYQRNYSFFFVVDGGRFILFGNA
jgi:hypothetical protein